MPSWQTPTPEQVARARAQLTQPQHYRYFFDQLANPRWLMPLREQGFFAHPPAPVTDPEGGITFPSWPASRYLARMAVMDEESAQAALEIVLEMPETENPRVHEDLVDAALAMPPGLAARLVPKARRWVRLPYQFLLPEKLGALVSLLARGGQVGSALDLARTLLAVRVEERAPVELAGGERFEFPPEARPHIDLWHYQQIVERNIPDLVEAVGEHALEVLCAVLNAAVRLSRYGPDDTGPGDRSHVWRRSIAGHDDLAGHDVEDVLVTAIRDAAERLVAGEAARVSALVALLEGYPWRIFHRLALHLLRLFPSNAAGLIAERLVDRERFEDPDLWHEYTLLARERFADLAPAQRETILSWIESGPNLAEVAAVWEWREHGPDVPAEAEFGVAYRRHWQLRHLARVRDALPTPWRERHDALARELGDREQEEFPDYRSGVRSGPISPVTADELRAMGVDELLAYLRDWQPGSPYPLDPSREGLGGELTRVVVEDPVSFAAVGNRFRDLDPAYVGALLAGLREAVRRGTPIDWAPVLELCRWVIGRMAEPPPPEDGEDDPEPADRPLRGTVADLLEAGLAVGGQGAVPFTLRGELWAVLEPLTDDPEPPYEGDEPSDRSINTTRGKAMHAVVRYALWARRSLEGDEAVAGPNASNFDALPEVRAVLDRHLDPQHDRSRVIRSVYGQWLPWLVQLDVDWARRNLARILPTDAALRGLRDAAWDTYLRFCEAYDDTYGVLREEYARAAAELDSAGTDERKPDRRLAEHLMALYGRGRLDLDDPDNPLARFYAAAPAALRGHALEYVGRILRQTAVIPPAILARYRALWERRLAEARGADPAQSAPELTAFGWWFVSGKFPDDWGIGQLRAALGLVPRTEPDHLVIERLAALAATMPAQAVECLHLIIEGDTRNRALTSRHEHTRRILAAALREGGEPARIATALVHTLGGRGYLQYRDLLTAATR